MVSGDLSLLECMRIKMYVVHTKVLDLLHLLDVTELLFVKKLNSGKLNVVASKCYRNLKELITKILQIDEMS